MTYIYDVVAKRHKGTNKPDICLFYDEDRETSIKAMKDYNSKHGFTVDTDQGNMTIADIILRQRTPTGAVISETSYHEIFDVYGNRRSV